MTAPAPPPPPYASRIIVGDDLEIARWRPLAHWLLVIPHAFIAQMLTYVANALAVVSWFIILFTGRLPKGIADFQAMIMRYTFRTYGYLFGLTEEYPPFNFDLESSDPGDYVLSIDVEPELEDRNRVTVFFRIFLLIPLMIVGLVYGLIFMVVTFIAWFAVLFTGRYPEGLRDVTVGVMDFSVRLQTYANLLVDPWPPVNLMR